MLKEALIIHVAHYEGYKENYTIGIMRNLQKQKESGKRVSRQKENSFNNFEQRDYDYEEIEKRLLAN